MYWEVQDTCHEGSTGELTRSKYSQCGCMMEGVSFPQSLGMGSSNNRLHTAQLRHHPVGRLATVASLTLYSPVVQ